MRPAVVALVLAASSCNRHDDKPTRSVRPEPVPAAPSPARAATPSIVAISEASAGSGSGSGAAPYEASFPVAPSEHVEMKATAMGPLDVHLALADLPAKAESLELIWFDLDPAVAASPAKAVEATCNAFKVAPQFVVAATPVWLPALEGLRAIDERPVAGFTSKSLEVGGLAACRSAASRRAGGARTLRA